LGALQKEALHFKQSKGMTLNKGLWELTTLALTELVQGAWTESVLMALALLESVLRALAWMAQSALALMESVLRALVQEGSVLMALAAME
jgi:hypothetical protein